LQRAGHCANWNKRLFIKDLTNSGVGFAARQDELPIQTMTNQS